MPKRKIEISSNETNLINKMNENLTRKTPLAYAIPPIDDRPSIDINENKVPANAYPTKYCKDIHKINEMIQKSKELEERVNTCLKTKNNECIDSVPTKSINNESYEMVNHPDHYNNYDKEVIDMIEAIWGTEKAAIWCEITAFKYRMRMGTKPDNDIIQDINKEKWYLNKFKELKSKYDYHQQKESLIHLFDFLQNFIVCRAEIILRNLIGSNTLYIVMLNDITVLTATEKKYRDEKVAVAYIAIDNVEDILQYVHDKFANAVSDIDEKLKAWADSLDGIIKSYDTDKYCNCK